MTAQPDHVQADRPGLSVRVSAADLQQARLDPRVQAVLADARAAVAASRRSGRRVER